MHPGIRLLVAGVAVSLCGISGMSGASAGSAPVADSPPELVHTPDMLPDVAGGPGFYVRASLGVTKPHAGSLSTRGPLVPPDTDVTGKADPSVLLGAGAGYRVSDWLRVEATLDHAFSAGITADSTCPTCFGTARVATDFAQTVGLGSVFLDLPGIWRVSPYVGASLGLAYLDVGSATLTAGGLTLTGKGTSSWNLAWGGSLGALVDLGHGVSADIGYRYLDYANSDLTLSTTGASASARNVQSHAVRLGVIWQPW